MNDKGKRFMLICSDFELYVIDLSDANYYETRSDGIRVMELPDGKEEKGKIEIPRGCH